MTAQKKDCTSEEMLHELRLKHYARYLLILTAPQKAQSPLLALYLFSEEIASIKDHVSEPMIGLIRLQWWKDALETLYATGQVKDHPLLHAIAKHRDDISHSDLNEMIDARMDECEALQPASWDEFVKYASAPQYATLKAAQGILYKRSDAHNHMASISEKDLKKESIKNPAIIYGAVGTLIRAPYDAMHQRMRLPSDLLAKHSLHQQDFYDASCAQKIKPFILTLTKKLKPYCILAPYDAVFAHQIVATRRLSRLAKDPTRLWQPVTAIDGAMLPLTLSFKKLLGQL